MTANREVGQSVQRMMFWREAYATESTIAIETRKKDPLTASLFDAVTTKYESTLKLPNIRLSGTQNPSKKSNLKSIIHAGNMSCRPAQMEYINSYQLKTASDKEDTMLRNADFAHSVRGRTYDYLKERVKSEPEAKFSYPLTSSMEMSWGVNFKGTSHNPQYGKKRVVNDTFYTKNNFPSTYLLSGVSH